MYVRDESERTGYVSPSSETVMCVRSGVSALRATISASKA